MNFEKMPVEEPEPTAPKQEKTGLFKLTDKVKTTVGLGAAIVGTYLHPGNFEQSEAADAPRRPVTAERGAQNDATRREHFNDFSKLYAEGKSAFNKVKSQKDAEHVAAYLDTVVHFLKASEWQTRDDKPDLDKRYLTSLDDIGALYQKLEQQYGVPFEGARKAELYSVRAPFASRLGESQALKEVHKAEKKLPQDDTGNRGTYVPRTSGGASVSINTSRQPIQVHKDGKSNSGSAPRLTPNRSSKK